MMVNSTPWKLPISEMEKFHSRGSKIGASLTKFSPTGEKAMLTDCLKEKSLKWTMQIMLPISNSLTTLSLGCHLAIFTSSKDQKIVNCEFESAKSIATNKN